MKYMTKLDWGIMALSITLAVLFGLSLGIFMDTLKALSTDVSNTIFGSVICMIVTYKLGGDFFVQVVSTVRSRRIDHELKMERAFREMGNK